MKKIILGGFAAIAIAVLAAVNVNMNSQSENLLSDLALANVEALADEGGESSGGSNKICYYQGTSNYADYYECTSTYPNVGSCGNTTRTNKYFSMDRHVCN
jgi:mevalonate kinase